jgi:hypothetical protein
MSRIPRTSLLALTFILSLGFSAWCQSSVSIDVIKSKDQGSASSSITVSGLTTHGSGELLLAFFSTDGARGSAQLVSSVSTAGLTWRLIARSNRQAGTAEIWSAWSASALNSSSMQARLSRSASASATVIALSGVNSTTPIGATAAASAPSGAPSLNLNTMGNNSLVFGVGNDWDNAIGRVAGPNQSLVHQYLSPVGDTYWVQAINGAVASPSTVTVNDVAPASDEYNLAAVEVLSGNSAPLPTYTLSGAITPANLGNNSSVTLSQNGTTVASVNGDSNGNFQFAGLSDGTFSVTPVRTGVVFTPASQTVTIAGAAASVSFSATTVPVSGISLVQANVQGNEQGGFTSMSVSFKNPTLPGTSLIVTGTCVRPAGTLSVSDSVGNQFEVVAGPMSNPGQEANAYIWRVRSGLGGPDAITIKATSGGCAMETHVSEWQGLSTSSLYDQTTFAQASTGLSFSSGLVTTTQNGELIFGYTFPIGNSTPGAGFTLLTYVDGDADEYQVQPAAGPVQATFTQDHNGTWFAAIATFPPASP